MYSTFAHSIASLSSLFCPLLASFMLSALSRTMSTVTNTVQRIPVAIEITSGQSPTPPFSPRVLT
jgi:hypothetical protein